MCILVYRENRMFRPMETTELRMEETNHHVLNSFMVQEIYGDRDVAAVTSIKIEGFFCSTCLWCKRQQQCEVA